MTIALAKVSGLFSSENEGKMLHENTRQECETHLLGPFVRTNIAGVYTGTANIVGH